jgi:XTP/dITP diphosphohydrolase
MSDPTLLVATRSAHKLREIREILGDPRCRIVDLDDIGIPETAEEDALECFQTFEENALAKARHFQRLSGAPTLADDSGLVVDVLDGQPGVRSKRFSPDSGLSGAARDGANNELLLRKLATVPDGERSARYVCVVALATEDGEHCFRGECEGSIALQPRGTAGFGYDPLFVVPGDGRTMAELDAAEKNAISHRSRALRAAEPVVRQVLDRFCTR